MKPPAFCRLRWPAGRFYWAILDTSDFPRAAFSRRPSAQQLGYVFERVLPGLAIEQVHAVYRQLPGDGRALACGVQAEALATIAEDVVALSPESLPAFLAEPVDAASLNLLTGRFLPAALRRLRRLWIVQLMVLLVICVALLVYGLERRTMAVRSRLADVAEARASMLSAILGPAGEAAPGLPPELQLAAEVRRLEQTRNSDGEIAELTDCSGILEAVLMRWPAEVSTRAESISITEGAVTVRAAVETMADAQRFASAFVDLPGWRLNQPRSEARRDQVVVTMRLEAGKPGGQS